MLGKLLRYEFKATGRTFLPLYGALLLMALINKVLFAFNDRSNYDNFALGMSSGIAAMLYGFIICAVFALALIVMIQRFYKNLLGDEGYLMFTLPVRPWALIAAKTIVAAVWMIASIVVTMLSVFILAFDTGFFTFLREDIGLFMYDFNATFGAGGYLLIIELCLLMLVGLLMSVLHIYVAIAIGHQAPSHKLLASFGAYVGVSLVTEIAFVLYMRMLSNVIPDITIEAARDAVPVVGVGILLILVVWALFGAAYYVVTNYLLTKRLNLE